MYILHERIHPEEYQNDDDKILCYETQIEFYNFVKTNDTVSAAATFEEFREMNVLLINARM